jgi:hypothetical protein
MVFVPSTNVNTFETLLHHLPDRCIGHDRDEMIGKLDPLVRCCHPRVDAIDSGLMVGQLSDHSSL